jgi:hypothetical protein
LSCSSEKILNPQRLLAKASSTQTKPAPATGKQGNRRSSERACVDQTC